MVVSGCFSTEKNWKHLPFVGEDITGVKDEAVDFRGLVLLEPEDSKSSADKVVASSSSFSSQHRL